MRTYTATLKNRNVELTDRDLATFRDTYIDGELATRMSELLWLDMYVYDAEFGISPHDVLDAIHSLERGEQPNGVKAATPFSRPPLKGLWHKHFFSARFLVNNIVLGFGRDGLEKLVNEVMDPGKSSVVTEEMIKELTHRATHEPLEKRASHQKLTGEWVIYFPHDGKNYYLCCNAHGAGDQFIYDRIMEHCTREFPALPEWLALAQGS